MPEPREPIAPTEPVCEWHGLPGSVCDARRARQRRWNHVAFAGVLAALVVALAFDAPSGHRALVAALFGAMFGMRLVHALGGKRG